MCDGRLHFYDRLQILEEKDRSLEQRERLRAVEKPLLAWYASRARKLPWREDPKPYRVWISEIMLQQTRVEAVAVLSGLWRRFRNRSGAGRG
ncbi:MAG: hypothetical protein ACLUEJ_15440 [Clostridium sp.]